MVRHSNYWFESCPTKRQITAGLVKNVDILVIGGGIAGVSLLYQLINAGLTNSYLVEENSIAYRASGRSSGQLVLRGRALFHEMPDDQGARYLRFLLDNNKRFVAGLRAAEFDSDLKETGGLRLACDTDELERLKNEADFIYRFTGVELPIYSASTLNHIFPNSNFIGGMFVPHEATFNPYKVVNGIRELTERSGVRIITDAQVQQVVTNTDETLSVLIRHRGVIRAKRVVYCTNTYTPSLLPDVAKCMSSFRGQMIATDVLSDSILEKIPTMSMSSNDCGEYFRLHGGRLLVGGMRNAIRGKQEGIIYDGELSNAIYEKLKTFTYKYIPVLDKAKFTHSWAGVMCSTPDGLPIIGPISGNQYIMAGFNGYGFSHVLSASMMIKDYIANGNSENECRDMFHPRRFDLCS